ncbi:MAG: alanine--tRNA ligase [Candidatus Nealsonbacteria bacterium]|nr:alanine--tRNA ligase [Candidatus Nealsonbacteria bacterium]
MISRVLRREFLDFFEKKGHKVVPSSSLLPLDTSVLLTTAGMQQFTPYLSNTKNVLEDFGTRHLTSIQKCFRTLDIEEVGDDTHHTFFEMLGNWSIGLDQDKGYFKQGAIEIALDFLGNILGLEKNKFWFTIFKGEAGIPKDKESLEIWQEQGISQERIIEFGIKDNFWGPTADTGPCGPCSEIHYDRGPQYGCGNQDCGPNCERCKRFVELWNLVFMEYNKKKDGCFSKLPQSNVDTGIGFERLLAVLENKPSAYETDLFLPVIQKIEVLSAKNYNSQKPNFRIISDHIRGAVFLAAEGIFPSNTNQGYILRRILRRAMRIGKLINLPRNFLIPLSQETIKIYQEFYPEHKTKQADILSIIQKEETKFEKTLEQGLKEFEKLACKGEIDGSMAFHLYNTYGFPLEMTEEMAVEKKLKVDKKSFEQAFIKHQEISRIGATKKFGGTGAEQIKDEEQKIAVIKLHTATHLLYYALREALKDNVRQMGCDINSERLRFDFSHSVKLTQDEIKKVEQIVNQRIKQDLEVEKQEMECGEAIKSGALAFFREKYPERVFVYTIRDKKNKDWVSKEICAGPHVKRTSELGCFKIIKEQSSSAGIRRIKAILI